MGTSTTARFSDRVDNYTRYRPGYPPEILELMHTECGLLPAHVVADVAAGTGLFTELLLKNGNRVFAVEPNAGMRQAGERLLWNYPNLTFINGTAENTSLPRASVDFVTAAQAAHWFDRPRARSEFLRILKPGGWCVLIWHERRTDTTPFLRDYEQLLLTYGTDYEKVRHEHTTDSIHEFYGPADFEQRVLEYRQQFDFAGAAGRLLSSSYVPLAGHPNYEPMMRELDRIFHAHAVQGKIEFEYTTRVFYGRLT